MKDVVYQEEEEIHKLKIELAETQRDRDMLANELERSRNEMKEEMSLPLASANVNDSGVVDEETMEFLRSEKARLIAENEHLLKSNVHLGTLQQIVWEEENEVNDLNSEHVMTKLIEQLDNTKRENQELNKKLTSDSPTGRKGFGFAGTETKATATSPVKENIQMVLSPVEVQSLKQANTKLKQELDQLRKEKEKFKRDLLKIQQTKVVFCYYTIYALLS